MTDRIAAGRRRLPAAAAAGLTLLAGVVLARPAGATVLVSETFESYSGLPAGGWVDDTESDSWSIRTDGSKVARQDSTVPDTYLLVTGQAGWRDYTVSADVRPGSTAARTGLVARFVDSNNYYSLLLEDGEAILAKKVRGSTTVLQRAGFGYDTARFHRLSVTVSGSTVTGSADGRALVSGDGTGITAGRVGLDAGGVAEFDNVSVDSSPTGPSPTATPSPTTSPTAPPTPGPTAPPTTGPPSGRVVPVSTSPQLRSAMAGAAAGDTIVLADGSYTIGTLSGKAGTSARPVTLRAANRGKAVIAAGQLEIASSSYVTVDGLDWTNSDTLKVTGSTYVRLTRNHFHLTEDSSLKWVLVQGAGSAHNRIDHNLFEDKHQLGNFITLDGSDTAQTRYDRIDHNHFRDIGPRATNEMEAIRVGWSGISRSSGYTTIESNLFENCDGDPEIVSVKSNDNTVRHNTFRTSQGVLSARHGNRNSFHGNVFLGGGKAGTGGIRVYGQDHRVYDNYFEGLTGTGYSAALALDGGDVDTSGALSSHFRVHRATVVHNTFVDNVANIEIARNYSLPPVDSVIADNVVTGSQGALFAEVTTPVRMTYSGNLAWPTGSAVVGIDRPATAVRVVDPQLSTADGLWKLGSGSPARDASVGSFPYVTEDVDGQPRSGVPDVGSDEYSTAPVLRRPLAPSDVGVSGPDAA